MRLLKASLLASVLFALLVGTAAADTAAGLDPSFGHAGVTTVDVAEHAGPEGFAVTPDGHSYVLASGKLLAFGPDGRLDEGFGKQGRVTVAPFGDSTHWHLAVDSQGRPLVAGSVRRSGRYEAFVIRFLPDGQRDPSFGSGGEVDTDFGLPATAAGKKPNLNVTSIAVDAQDRPVIGGGYGKEIYGCTSGFGGPFSSFVARLTAAGAPDPTFAGTGLVTLAPRWSEERSSVIALALTPEGGPALLRQGCVSEPRIEEQPSVYEAFGASGEAAALDPGRRSSYARPSLAIDPSGRILLIAGVPPVLEGHNRLARLLPNGDLDPSFGRGGSVVLKQTVRALTVDAESRPILAVGEAGIVLRRFGPDGTPDAGFGPGGRLTARAWPPHAIALDDSGRIYTVGSARGPKRKTGFGIQVARFIPGP